MVRVTYMLKVADISSGRSLKPKGTEIRVHFMTPEAEKDLEMLWVGKG